MRYPRFTLYDILDSLCFEHHVRLPSGVKRAPSLQIYAKFGKKGGERRTFGNFPQSDLRSLSPTTIGEHTMLKKEWK